MDGFGVQVAYGCSWEKREGDRSRKVVRWGWLVFVVGGRNTGKKEPLA